MRGQTEIIGLMLIMVVLAIGFLFYIRFSTDTNDQPRTTENELTRTFLSSLVKTDIACGSTVQNAVKRLANGNPTCTASELTSFFNDTLTPTFTRWGYNYRFVVDREGEELLPVLTNANIPDAARCNPSMDRIAEREIIRLYPNPGNAEIRLELC